MEIRPTMCCGVREYSGLNGRNKEILEYVIDYRFAIGHRLGQYMPENFRYLIFTDNREFENGDSLRNFITERNLGTVIETASNHNPNSGNMVKVYIWTLDDKALMTWYNSARA